MLFRPAARLIPTLLGAALVVSAGAAAIAEPGGAPRELMPTAKLSANGGLSAPSDDSGGVEAGAPIPEPAPAPAPATEAPEPAGVVTAPPAEEPAPDLLARTLSRVGAEPAAMLPSPLGDVLGGQQTHA